MENSSPPPWSVLLPPAPALAALLFNGVIIASILALGPIYAIPAVACGTTDAAAAQALAQYAVLHRRGFRWIPTLGRLLKETRLRLAAPEDIDYRTPRGLDKSLLRSLLGGERLRDGRNILLTGPTGVGKTFVACALGNASCRQGFLDRLVHKAYRITLKGKAGLKAGQVDGLPRNGRTISVGMTGRLQPEHVDGLAGIRTIPGWTKGGKTSMRL